MPPTLRQFINVRDVITVLLYLFLEREAIIHYLCISIFMHTLFSAKMIYEKEKCPAIKKKLSDLINSFQL